MFYISLNIMSLTHVKATWNTLNGLFKIFFYWQAYIYCHIKWIVKHQFIWFATRSLWKFTTSNFPNDFRFVCHSEKRSPCHYLVLENEYLANISNHICIFKFWEQIVFKPLCLCFMFYVFNFYTHILTLWEVQGDNRF